MYNFTLYMTTDCNFKCQYCYEDYHNHYQLNEKTLVDSLEFMMNYGDRGKVLIDFLGGEPLLKKDLIYKAVAYIKDNYPEREVKYYITTNCSMMDDRFIAFMKENHFTVRLSFDGNKETHDLNRAAKDGVSCYEKIFENIMKVKDSGLNFSVRMTVTENTIPYMFENICYLHEHGLDNICMIMDVYLKISDELKVEFEKQVGQILQYYLAEAAAGRVFTIDQFDGKMFNMGIKQCVLLVHSISGVYGLNFVQNYPEKVKGFIAVDNTVYDEELAEAMEVEKKYMLQGIDEFQKIKNSFSSLEEFQTALKADPEKYGAALPQVSGYTYTETDREEYIQAYSLSSNDTIRNEVNGMDQSLLSIKNKKFPSALPVLTMISSENVQNVPAWETAHRNQLDLESGNHQLYIVNGGHYIWYTNLTQVVQLINEWRMENHF